jgi:tetratricopeptide (TPR) repeat protein
MPARTPIATLAVTAALALGAIGLALQGRIAETPALFEEAKAGNPAYRESILVELEATVRWVAGDYRAAAAEAARVTRRPAAATAAALRGRALAGARDYSASAAAYAQALRFEPRDWALRREYANVLLALGRRSAARDQMAASLALNPRQSLPAGFAAR